ncbi:MAG: HEAT repeat domain-containing protein [Elusimicrobia bacterium]|nr:HEAT repeat domain-containing protein [Elusimicrobiota bacterium]
MTALLLASFTYLYLQGHPRRSSSPPEPAVLDLVPTPVLGIAEIERLRKSTADSSPEVRWAALQLLVALRDPEIIAVMDKILQQDTDPEIRRRGVELMRQTSGNVLPPLIRGLKDPEKEVRLSSLRTLAEIGDPAAIPWITESLKDYEAEVKVEALRALSCFQDKRKAQFQALADKLRQDYAAAVQRSQNPSAFGSGLLGQPRR